MGPRARDHRAVGAGPVAIRAQEGQVACTVTEWSAGQLQPAPLERKTPAENIRIEHDLSEDIDCDLQGVTILVSQWTIHPDDDDGTLTLSTPTVDTDGLVASTAIQGGTDGSLYRLIGTYDLSDGQTIIRTSSIPVLETRAANA